MGRFAQKLVYPTLFIFLVAVLAFTLGVFQAPFLFAQGSAVSTECSDEVDNDGDGLIDYPNDPGCDDPLDNDEVNVIPNEPLHECSDGSDNDGDGFIDYPADEDCESPEGFSEGEFAAPTFECSDTIDNDGDGLIDYPDDPGCGSIRDDSEFEEAITPRFNFLTPTNGSTVSGQVVLLATVDEIDPLIVKYQISGQNIQTKTAFFNGSGWQYTWDTTEYQNQIYQIVMVVFDDSNESPWTSDPISVNLFNESSEPTISITNPNDGAVIRDQENYELRAEVFDGPVTNLKFELSRDNNVINLLNGQQTNSSYWQTFISSTDYHNGIYQLIVKATTGSGFVESPSISFTIDNSIEPSDIGIDFIQPTDDQVIAGIFNLKAKTDLPVSQLSFVLFNNFVNLFLGIADNVFDNNWELSYDTSAVSNGLYFLVAEAYIDSTGQFGSDQIVVDIQNQETAPMFHCSDGLDNDGDGLIDLNDPGCESPEDDDEFNEPDTTPPPELTTQCSDGFDNDGDGLTDLNDPGCESPEDDDEFNEPDTTSPSESIFQCSDGFDNDGDGLIDLKDPGCESPEDDDEFNEPPETTIPEEPEPEPDRLDPELAEECTIAGIIDYEACNRFLFEISDYPEADFPEQLLPIECLEVDITDIQQCDQFLKNTFMPDACRQASINSVDDCNIYLSGLYLSSECLAAEIFDNRECENFLNKIYLDVECLAAEKTDSEECQDYILETYAVDVTCNGLDDLTCNRALRERHLNDLISAQKSIKIIEEVISPYIRRSVTLQQATGEETEVRLEDFIPIIIKEDVTITLLPSVSQVLLNEKDEIIQTPSAIIIFDNDGDGVPDEIERRLGTNPFLADTDGDGFDDGYELRRNFNPSGGGELPVILTPTEQALINQVVIEQPKVSGRISRQLLVKKVEDVDVAEGDPLVQKLSGSAFPNSVVTLYIYSELPLVVTVSVDQFGNWEYTLQQSLLDGKHEVYVTVNDNTGRIVAKSNPLIFLIQEAKAISPEEFISAQRTARGRGNEQQILIYILLAVIFTISGIVLFVYFIRFRKGSSANKTTGGLIDGGVE